MYRCVTSGKMRETIEIDFVEKFQTSIPCIENNTSKKYSVYLAIINGDLLAALYDEFRDRLLEKNVRSFLQVKGGVNKGIRDTLRDEPDMFLAYNNGISVTAESVEIVRDENGKPSIKRIRDMQIVNGGQTTASIFNAKNDRKIATDLSQVFVQMKISVIHSADDMDEIVPRISTFANTQNKIQVVDFSANDPFHRRIEELSRTIWAPAQGGIKPRNWFYERARGQYADKLKLAVRDFYVEGNSSAIHRIESIASAIGRATSTSGKENEHNRSSRYSPTVSQVEKLSRLLDYCKTMRMSYSYKPILILTLLHYGDQDGCISIENAAVYFREYYSNRKAQGLAIEKKQCIYLRDDVTDAQIIANLLSNPVKALIESGFFFYNEDSHVFSVSPDIWSTIDRSNKAAIMRICRQKLKDYYKD